MEKHFLDEYVEGEAGFKKDPWYNPDGDCVVCLVANEAVIADRIDELLTIYRSANDDRPIGFQIKGVHALITKFGLDGLTFETVEDSQKGQLESVSIASLLLAAYDSGPRTIGRRQAYATAMESPQVPSGILRSEMIPA